MSAKPRILLFQVRRPGDPVRDEERRSFAGRSGLDLEQIVPHDLLQGSPSLEEVRAYDAVMVGGSGDFYVSKGNVPHGDAFFELLAEIVEIGHPTFASCFGFQCLVQSLGGEIVHDPDRTEVGTYELTLTEAGREDPLFGGLPPRFRAQLGRKDRAARYPELFVNLARSAAIPYQALRVPERPIWASQFHPELDRETNVGRFVRYMDGYAPLMSEEEREAAFSRFTDSPEACTLLRRFVELVFD